MLAAVLPDTARRFAIAVVMPNLKRPVRNASEADAYRGRIPAALPAGMDFEPLMRLCLTEGTLPAEALKAKGSGFMQAVKYYPAAATTNSDSGVTDIPRVDAVLEAMHQQELHLLLNGEVTDPGVNLFDREAPFSQRVPALLLQRQPGIKVVWRASPLDRQQNS